MPKYRLTPTETDGVVDIEPLEPNEADALRELISDLRHKFAEMDARLGRVLMRLDALEKSQNRGQDSRALD